MKKPRGSASPRRLYVDTSAYLCVLLGEDGAKALSDLTDGAELLSSVLLVLEAKRNLIRLAREGALTPQQYQSCATRLDDDVNRFVLRDLTLDLCQSLAMPAVATPRSLDLVHLRTARWFHSSVAIDAFLTTDDGQARAAREMGLPTR